jgi:hypothetical protein
MKFVVRDCVTYKFLGAERSVRVTAPWIRGAVFITSSGCLTAAGSLPNHDVLQIPVHCLCKSWR